MRKIVSKQSEARRRKKNQTIIGIVLIIVMFGSVFGIIIGSFGKKDSSNGVEYNGFKFVESNGFWLTNVGGATFVFKYNPHEVNDISFISGGINKYEGRPLYVYSESDEAKLEIYRSFDQVAQRMQEACVEGVECGGDLPIKGCEDNFIIIQEASEIGIRADENCVFIDGPKENLTMVTDEFLFKTLGIRA